MEDDEKFYSVIVTETLQKSVMIKAKDAEEAVRKVTKQYDDEDIILDSSDFIEVSIVIDLSIPEDYLEQE
jgi:hypothetical protein